MTLLYNFSGHDKVVNLSQVIDITFAPQPDIPSLEVNQINIKMLFTTLYKHKINLIEVINQYLCLLISIRLKQCHITKLIQVHYHIIRG